MPVKTAVCVLNLPEIFFFLTLKINVYGYDTLLQFDKMLKSSKAV